MRRHRWVKWIPILCCLFLLGGALGQPTAGPASQPGQNSIRSTMDDIRSTMDNKGRDRVGFDAFGEQDPSVKALEGKKLMVRVYNDWRQDPSVYKLVPAEIHNLQFTVRPADMAPSAILAVWGADQVSPELTTALEGVLWIKAK